MILSTRSRLTIFFTILSGAILIGSMTLLYRQISYSLKADFQKEMEHDSVLIAEIFKEEMRLNAFNEFREEIEEFGIELQIIDESQNVMLVSDGWEDNRQLDSQYAIYEKPVSLEDFGSYVLRIMRSKEAYLSIQKTILFWMIVIIPIMMIICALAGYYFSGKALRPMEFAYEKLNKFTADASHELRIPLTALRGILDVTLRKDRSGEEYRETLQLALEEAEHLSHLTQDLLLLAREGNEQIHIPKEKTDLKLFVEDLFGLASALNLDNKVDLILEENQDGWGEINTEKIRQAVLNLVDNAIKYNNKDGWVRIFSSCKNGYWILEIKDNGIGIPEDNLGKIFDRFFRVDKVRSRHEGGTGLGLSIVKWIVEAHGGTIQAKSIFGQGSEFTIRIPLSSPHLH